MLVFIKIVPNSPFMQRISLYSVVNEVGVFQKPASISSGVFHLRTDLLKEYNPFFYHYSKSLVSQAEQFQKKERASILFCLICFFNVYYLDKERELMACPPILPIKFTKFFKPILRLFESYTLIRLIRVVFERISKRSRFVSDGLFHRALFLTGMALNEQKRVFEEKEDVPFYFWERAKEEKLFDFLSKLENRPEVEAHANLLWWVLEVKKTLNFLIKRKILAIHRIK